MTPRLRATAFVAASVVSLLMLSACGKNPPPASKGSAAATSKPAAQATGAQTRAAPALQAAHGATALAASGSATTPSAAAPVAALSVAKLTLGTEVNAEHQVTRPARRFASTDKTIYASVVTQGSSRGATLNAKWTYLEGTSQLVSSISQSIATDGAAITTFKVQNPDLWPEGRYQVEITLDGKSVGKQEFEISKR